MSNLKPELHDFGKLISHDISDFPTTDGEQVQWHGEEAFANVDWNSVSVQVPINPSWLGAVHHHDNGQDKTPKYDDLATSPAPDDLKVDILLLMVCDHLAATSSRAVSEEIKKTILFPSDARRTQVHTLWKLPSSSLQAKTLDNPDWTPIKTRAAVLALIELIREDDADNFAKQYNDYLSRIPEDKIPPAVTTSLATHMRLVNQYYRTLQKHVKPIRENGKPTALEYNGIRVTNRKDAEERWQFQLLKCTLLFPQTPVRVRDLNVFALLEKHTAALLKSHYCPYVLFHTSDTFYLMLPNDESKAARVENLFRYFLKDGFYVEIERNVLPLDKLTLVPKNIQVTLEKQINQLKQDQTRWRDEQLRVRDAVKEKNEKLFRSPTPTGNQKEALENALAGLVKERDSIQSKLGKLKNKLDQYEKELEGYRKDKIIVTEHSLYDEPIMSPSDLETDTICELCQLRAAEQVWTTPDDALSEALCRVCYHIRETIDETHGTPGALASWERDEPTATVAWVKLSLNYAQAQAEVTRLFGEFIDASGNDYNIPIERRQLAKASLRPTALLADFTSDYQRLTQQFDSALEQRFSASNLIRLTKTFRDFYIVRLEAVSDVLLMVETFCDSLKKLFPQALDACPVRLCISVANVKHPFFDHWRFCRQAEQVINVQLVGSADLHLTIEQYDELRKLDVNVREISTFLHRVAAIETYTNSRILPQVEFIQNERKLPSNIALALRVGELAWNDVLNYYKLARR